MARPCPTITLRRKRILRDAGLLGGQAPLHQRGGVIFPVGGQLRPDGGVVGAEAHLLAHLGAEVVDGWMAHSAHLPGHRDAVAGPPLRHRGLIAQRPGGVVALDLERIRGQEGA